MTTQMKRFFALCAVVLGAIALFPNQIVVATDTNAATVTGILNDPNFRSVLQALEQRNETETPAEPVIVTTYGRQAQMMRVDYVLSQPQYMSAITYASAAPNNSQSAQSEMRVFKVNPNTFYEGLRSTSSVGFTGTNVSQAALAFFKLIGVDLDAPGRSISFNNRLGLLFVKATPSDLRTVERTIQALNQVAPQVHLKARFIEVLNPNPELPQVALPRTLTNSSHALMSGILTREQAKDLLQSLAKMPNAGVLAEPEIITTSGRQAQMRGTIIPVHQFFDSPKQMRRRTIESGPFFDSPDDNLTVVIR
jgi:type II secretory pathway component GspD/PulD (secretin)